LSNFSANISLQSLIFDKSNKHPKAKYPKVATHPWKRAALSAKCLTVDYTQVLSPLFALSRVKRTDSSAWRIIATLCSSQNRSWQIIRSSVILNILLVVETPLSLSRKYPHGRLRLRLRQ
jgi:hypothetical protein